MSIKIKYTKCLGLSGDILCIKLRFLLEKDKCFSGMPFEMKKCKAQYYAIPINAKHT